jgi:hypothetical protein
VKSVGVQVARAGARGAEGIEGARLSLWVFTRLTRSAVAFAMIRPIMLLSQLKKAARLESSRAALADL